MIPMKIGIMGVGKIAGTMAATVERMQDAEVYAVASRSKERAESFAKDYGIPKAYGSYEEMAEDEQIELVYIATPHSEHARNARLCLEHGRHVLCEKSFAVNEAQAAGMIRLAREKGLLITEAMWVRYTPMAQTLKEVLASGVIGEPKTLTANLCYLIDGVPRIMDPNLAGGALLDVGVYVLTFASIVFGNEIMKLDSTVIKTESGVDAQNSITITYPGGRMAVLNSSIQVLSDRQGIVYGTDGFLVVENINHFESIKVYDRNRALIETHKKPEEISGYEYEVEACHDAIRAGLTQCPQMPHAVTLDVMRQMDALRRQWGIRYPSEDE